MKIKSIEKIDHIYIDEKGLGKEKEKVLKLLRDQEIESIFIQSQKPNQRLDAVKKINKKQLEDRANI